MIEPLHTEYVLCHAASNPTTITGFFFHLEKLPHDIRHELLKPLYLAYSISFEQKGTKQTIHDIMFTEFKKSYL